MEKQLQKDISFLRLAKEVSKNSSCLSRKIGSVLTKDNTIISAGYNGPAKRVKHCNERDKSFYDELLVKEGSDIDFSNIIYSKDICPRRNYSFGSGKGLFMCQASHSEANALLQAAYNGISTKNTTLYCYCEQVCKNCAVSIINAGVKELVYLKSDKPYDGYANTILKESGIIVREIDGELI